LIGWFNRTYVKTGKVKAEYGRIVHKAFDKRSKGDYDETAVFSHDEVDAMMSGITSLISCIEGLIDPPA